MAAITLLPAVEGIYRLAAGLLIAGLFSPGQEGEENRREFGNAVTECIIAEIIWNALFGSDDD